MITGKNVSIIMLFRNIIVRYLMIASIILLIQLPVIF